MTTGLAFNIRKLTSGSVVSVSFTFLGMGMVFVGASRLFLLLGSSGFYNLVNVNLHIWWHLIFYIGIACFVLAGKRINQAGSETNIEKYRTSDTIVVCLFLLFTLLSFFIAQPLDPILSQFTGSSIVDTWGLHHFIAFVFTGVAAVYVYLIKGAWGKLLSVSVYPILAFLFLNAVQHGWELLTENLMLIKLDGKTIEQVEGYIILASLIFLFFGFLKVKSELAK